jgi:hypothetical protein
MWGSPDAVDALVGLVDHLGQGRATKVGQLHRLEAGPQALDRVQLRRHPARSGGTFSMPSSHGSDVLEVAFDDAHVDAAGLLPATLASSRIDSSRPG